MQLQDARNYAQNPNKSERRSRDLSRDTIWYKIAVKKMGGGWIEMVSMCCYCFTSRAIDEVRMCVHTRIVAPLRCASQRVTITTRNSNIYDGNFNIPYPAFYLNSLLTENV